MDELREWLRGFGHNIEPVLDDKYHRFDEGDNKKKKLWYRGSVKPFRGKDVVSLTWGHWATGEKQSFHSKGNGQFNETERREYCAEIEKRKKDGEKRLHERQEKACVGAEKMWASGIEVSEWSNDYIQRKQIGPGALKRNGTNGVGSFSGVKRSGDCLLIPMSDVHGKLWGIQRIFPNGDKRFLPGQRTVGTSFRFTGRNSSPIVICEGFATGASVHLASEYETYCAFTAGGLQAITNDIRNLHRNAEIIICGDDDRFNPSGKNIGREKAEEAALLVGGVAVFPEFLEGVTDYIMACAGNQPTDFNDLHCFEGLDEVRRQITRAVCQGTNGPGEPVSADRENAGEGKAGPSRAGAGIPGDSGADQKSARGDGDRASDGGDEKEKREKAARRQKKIEELGRKILDCRFKLLVDNEATLLYNITNIKNKEVVLCLNEELLLRRLKANIEEVTGKSPSVKYINDVYSYWRMSAVPLKEQPRSFTWGDEDEWSFKKLGFVPTEGEYPAWWEFLKRLSSYDDFMAFVWSIFEHRNTSRQFLWLSDINGEGGKSTIINVLADVFGESFEAINNTSTGNGARWLMGQLYGKRLVAWADCKNTNFCMSETVRNITSGDPVAVELKGQPLFTTKMYMKLIIGSNCEPSITGGGADTSRLIHLRLEQGPVKDDPTWANKLKEELPYFLWACRGVYESKCPNHGKIALSESTIGLVSDASSVTESRFEEIMEARLILGEGLTATIKEFQDMCKEEGFKDNFEVGNFKTFLRRHGVSVRRVGGDKPRRYYGLNITMRCNV